MLDESFLSPCSYLYRHPKSLIGLLWSCTKHKKGNNLTRVQQTKPSQSLPSFPRVLHAVHTNYLGHMAPFAIISSHSAAACQAGADAPLWQFLALQLACNGQGSF